MKKTLLCLALLAGSGSALAHGDRDVHLSCDVESQYSLSVYRKAFLFTHDSDPVREVGIGGGRLFVDGKEISLDAADQRRLAEFESELRELVPEVRKVATEAVEIAFSALVEVARGLSSNPEQTVAELHKARRSSLAALNRQPMAVLNGDAMKDVVEPIIVKFVPEIVSGAVSMAIKSAFGGEMQRDSLEKRIERMEREIDTRVEARAKALEPLAENMCRRLKRMDALDDGFQVRLPNGEPLQLLRMDPRPGEHSDRAP